MRNFDELIKAVKTYPQKKRVAVACAHDRHTLEGINSAYQNGIIIPILIGNKAKIESIIKEEGFSFLEGEILDVEGNEAVAQKAVELVHEGKADFIMKGNMQTSDLLRAVVSKESGIRESEVMSHVGLFEIPSYHKLMVITDGGMLPHPDLKQKVKIVENAVKVLKNLGYTIPKVAALAAGEVVNPKIKESVEAAALKQMNNEGQIKNCIIEGPISYDLMISREAAEIKGYQSPVTGDTDILLTPDMTTGNLLAKALMCSAGAKMAGIIVGAKVPIVLVSRGAGADEKYFSIVLAAAASA